MRVPRVESRSVAMAAERERVRQLELESERLREVVETLEIGLRAARAEHAKELADARLQVASANERARQARTRADALEEALAGGARPARELASSVGASPVPSPLHSPRGARPDDALASRPARRGAADAVADLVTWRAPGKSARVLGLGLYLQLCVSSLRSMPLPFWTVFCYGAIFSLAASLAWRILRRLRRGFAPHAARARAAAADANALADARRAREASVRRVAAKLGGWVASSAASRAPLAAESWIALERCFAWEHPPTTLKACVTLWLFSLVARVWWLPASTTVCVLWVGAFVVPPALVAAAPTAGAAAKTALDELVARFAHVLNDRRVQLAALGTIWSLTGYAGRTLLALAVATLFLTGGSNATRADDGVGSTARGGVVITELPESPARGDGDAAADAVLRSPEWRTFDVDDVRSGSGSLSSLSPRRDASRMGTGARHGRVVRHADVRLRERRRSSSSSESDGEDDGSPPSPLRRSLPGSRVGSAKSSPLRRGTGTRGRLEEATSARQRMIAERARRLLDDD